jgi:hypothetical protein
MRLPISFFCKHATGLKQEGIRLQIMTVTAQAHRNHQIATAVLLDDWANNGVEPG